MYKPGDSVVVENYDWDADQEGARDPNGAEGVVTADNSQQKWGLIEVELNDPLHYAYEGREDSKWLFLPDEIRPA